MHFCSTRWEMIRINCGNAITFQLPESYKIRRKSSSDSLFWPKNLAQKKIEKIGSRVEETCLKTSYSKHILKLRLSILLNFYVNLRRKVLNNHLSLILMLLWSRESQGCRKSIFCLNNFKLLFFCQQVPKCH